MSYTSTFLYASASRGLIPIDGVILESENIEELINLSKKTAKEVDAFLVMIKDDETGENVRMINCKKNKTYTMIPKGVSNHICYLMREFLGYFHSIYVLRSYYIDIEPGEEDPENVYVYMPIEDKYSMCKDEAREILDRILVNISEYTGGKPIYMIHVNDPNRLINEKKNKTVKFCNSLDEQGSVYVEV